VIKIIFESHSTTLDNENEIASGHYDVRLSPLGLKQSLSLGKRYEENPPDVVFCSDLSRSYETGKRAFGNKGIKIIRDKRLRECDYGDYTQHPADEVKPMKIERIDKPFPNGESYTQCMERMRDFLEDLLDTYDGKTVMIIGHRATQYGLEHWIKKIPLEEVIPAPWKWQPGWTYYLERLENGN
jgi:alpha-ribazole phosphatase/probable phosphoglycerate mutase